MAHIIPVVTFFLLVAHGEVGGDKAMNDYIKWKKADIMSYHEFFPERGLMEERLTLERAVEVVESAPAWLSDSLLKVQTYPRQEQDTATMMMEGTNAQQCLAGIANYLNDSLIRELSEFTDCIADVRPILGRLQKSWVQKSATYQAASQTALAGIDTCARTYPNRESQSRMTSCVDTYFNKYFNAVNNAGIYNAQNSPAMAVFTSTVARCSEEAGHGVIDGAWDLLHMLFQCSKLSDNIDTEAYEEEVSGGFEDYIPNINLMDQIFQCEGMYSSMVSQIEQKMLSDYYMKRSALQKYVIEPKALANYTAYQNMILHKYRDTISSTATDYPAEQECIESAHDTLDGIVEEGAELALECDKKNVNQTIYLIGRVDNNYALINQRLPQWGNHAILYCIKRSFVFADNTIRNCYDIMSSAYRSNASDVSGRIGEDIAVLKQLEDTFYNSDSLPCAHSVQAGILLKADMVLYNLQRCVYIGTGAKYSVTTAAPADLPDTTPSYY